MDINAHDSEIISLKNNREQQTLTIELIDENKTTHILNFLKVIDFNIQDFQTQNVLFEIYRYQIKDIPNEVITTYLSGLELSTFDQNLNAFILEPSVGMNGYIICRTMKCNRIDSSKRM